ncbi:MAG: efflux RND transporter periplasmic adaptor subunit [Candidatus Thiodiazotropha sp.]
MPSRRLCRFLFFTLSVLPAVSLLAAEKPAPQVIAAQVRETVFVDRIEALGTLKANESVELTSNVTEMVTAIHFDDGQRVDRDQVLVEMTSREEHALLEEARANLEEAKRQFNRVRRLESQGIEAQSLLDQRRREVDTARARLAAIESRLADRLIKAPFSGVLGLRNISVGALVETGDRISTLDDDRVMKLEFAVPSTYLASLAPGLPIRARARAFGERVFEGEIKAIDSRVDPVNRSLLVRAVLPNPERILKPGLLMTVELLRNRRQTLVIPESALMPKGREHYVMRLQGEPPQAEKLRIVIGSRRAGEVEVLEGLSEGDRVITHGMEKAREGEPVRVKGLEGDGRSIPDLIKPVTAEAAGSAS